MKKIMIALCIFIVLIIGCNNDIVPLDQDTEQVLIQPSEFFEGDLKKLEGHLGLTTGCLAVEYKGNKNTMGLSYEIWEKGKKVSSHDEYYSIPIENGFTGEISFSIKKLYNDLNEPLEKMLFNSVFQSKDGYWRCSKNIESISPSPIQSESVLEEAVTSHSDDSIPIWGIVGAENSLSTYSDIERTVKRADWGLMIRLWFKDEKQ